MADLKIQIKGFTDHLDKALKRTGSALGNLAKRAGTIFKSVGSYAAVAGGAIAGIAIQSLKIAGDFEQTAVAFRTMLKDGKLATKLLDDLTAFSTKTPFEPKEVYKAAKALLSFGVDVNDVLKTMKKLGDVSSGTGKDLNELAMIYGKVFVKGKAQGEELNQMSEAGIPILRELQKQYGATAAEIFKMGSAGKLSFDDIDTAFNNMTTDGGIFFQSMIAQSETLNGKISTLKGNWDELLKTLGKTDDAKKGVDILNEAVQGASELIKLREKDQVGAAQAFASSASEAGGTAKAIIGPFGQLMYGIAEKVLGSKAFSKTARRTTFEDIQEARIEAAEGIIASAAERRNKAGTTGLPPITGGASAQALLSMGALGGGGTLASLGGDISGGGFDARQTVAQEQLSVLKEIKDLTRESVNKSTTMTDEGRTAYMRSQTGEAIKD